MRHDLVTEGAWVDLRDISTVRARDRKAAMQGLLRNIKVDLEGGDVEIPDRLSAVLSASDDLAEAAALTLITEWCVPYLDGAVPSLDAIGDLEMEDYDRLLKLAEPAIKKFMPPKVSPDDHADPKSPSVPASA